MRRAPSPCPLPWGEGKNGRVAPITILSGRVSPTPRVCRGAGMVDGNARFLAYASRHDGRLEER
jgi:hypothetical protein